MTQELAYTSFESSSGASVHRLPLEVFPNFWACAYLIQKNEFRVLIDAGSGTDQSHQDLLAGVQEAGYQVSDKINHGVLHAGKPGSGKDTLWAPFLWAVGGPGRANVAIVRNEEINGTWGYAFESEVLVLNELRQAEAADRRALENRLKPLLAAPPDMITIQRKGLHPYDASNKLLVVAFSNERAAITLSSDDRRWMVLWSEADIMSPEKARALWHWYETGGYEAVAGWLWARDVSAFNPGAAPLVTEAKTIMQAAGLSLAEAWLVETIALRRWR